jgi:hypothetical protein
MHYTNRRIYDKCATLNLNGIIFESKLNENLYIVISILILLSLSFLVDQICDFCATPKAIIFQQSFIFYIF